MPNEQPPLVMGDIMDEQLESADGRSIGRVTDVEAEWREDGALVLTHLVLGPQAYAGRVSERLQALAKKLLRDRFEGRIPVEDVEDLGPTIRLRRTAEEYAERYGVARSERWIASHILRFIPGSGYP
jgi:hypothetical protein